MSHFIFANTIGWDIEKTMILLKWDVWSPQSTLTVFQDIKGSNINLLPN